MHIDYHKYSFKSQSHLYDNLFLPKKYENYVMYKSQLMFWKDSRPTSPVKSEYGNSCIMSRSTDASGLRYTNGQHCMKYMLKKQIKKQIFGYS